MAEKKEEETKEKEEKPVVEKEKKKDDRVLVNIKALLWTFIPPILLFLVAFFVLFTTSETKSFDINYLWESFVEILPFFVLDLSYFFFLRKDNSVPKSERTPDQINYPFLDKPKKWKLYSFLALIIAIVLFFTVILLNILLFKDAWWMLFYYLFDVIFGMCYQARRRYKVDCVKAKTDLGRIH